MSFEEFAVARLPAVLKFAAVLTGDRGLAEDVVQEALIWANARSQVIEILSRPAAYVRKMIVNEYLTWPRRSWRLVLSRVSTDASSGGLGSCPESARRREGRGLCCESLDGAH